MLCFLIFAHKKGWLPTLFGYSLQGLGKFGFYEVFKDVFAKILGKSSFIIN